MAKELQSILVSGEIDDIRLGGTDVLKKVLTEEEILALLPGLHTYARWRGNWDQTLQYYINDMVNDAGWLMYCTVQDTATTMERAAPQPMYELQSEFYPDDEPTVFTGENYTGQVIFGHEYTVKHEGYIDAVEVVLPSIPAAPYFQVFFVTFDADGNEQETRIPLRRDLIVADEWYKLQIPKRWFKDGEKFLVKFQVMNIGSAIPEVIPFNLKTNGADPAAGELSWVNEKTLKISKTNADASDVSTIVSSLPVGSVMLIGDDKDAPTIYHEYAVIVPPVDGGTFVFVDVQLQARKGDIHDISGDRIDFDIQAPVADEVSYYRMPSYAWPAGSYWAPFATVKGILERDAVPEPASGDAFGIRVWWQGTYSSDVWTPIMLGS